MLRIMPRFQLPQRLRSWIDSTIAENDPHLRSLNEELTGSPGPLTEFMPDGTVRKLSDEERVRKWGGTVRQAKGSDDDAQDLSPWSVYGMDDCRWCRRTLPESWFADGQRTRPYLGTPDPLDVRGEGEDEGY